MKPKELEALREMSVEDLGKDLQNKKAELFNLRFQLATGQLENTASIGALRRDIARVKTIIRLRQDGEGA